MTSTASAAPSGEALLTDDDERFLAAGRAFVDAGRVVPGLAVEPDGRARSWWWPLPTVLDRELLASLVEDASIGAQRSAAARLAAVVDAETRGRLVAAQAALAPRKPGRRTVPEAWLVSLVSEDPWLPASYAEAKLRAFEGAVARWVRSGIVGAGRSTLCLRIHEPAVPASKGPTAAGHEPWTIELLVRDVDERSLVVPVAEVWAGTAPFGPEVFEEVVGALGHLVRIAPELSALLDEARPSSVALPTDALVDFARDRPATLAEAGITVLFPSWWTRRGRIKLRAKVAKKSSRAGQGDGPVTESSLGLEALASFTWEAALGTKRLTKVELRALEAAAGAKQHLVQLRGEWVEVHPDEVSALLRHVGTKGLASHGDLLRTGLGLDGIALPDGIDAVEIAASGWLGELLDEGLHTSVAPMANPTGFDGSLRPYQERGVGWMAFLGRLGLGACLADDMGLGKTAQLIATLLADGGNGPTLVVAPVSVLGNWSRELERFAPGLRVLVHHGPGRFRDHEAPLAERVADHDVVLTTYSLVARDADELAAVAWDRLVLDEAQQVKNPGAAQTKAVRRLSAARRVALTGTPVENRLSELWSIMHVLNPGLLGTASSFRERFAVPIERDGDPEATELLRRMTAPFVLRRLKTDRSVIADLPDKIEQTERCPLTPEQATLYQAVVDDLLEASEREDGITRRGIVLAGITKLKQVCNHPAHFLGDGSALPGRSGKLTRIDELMDEILDVGDKVLCFTQFAEWGTMLVPHFRRRLGVDPLWLHGGVRRRARDEMVEQFQDPAGSPVFLLSLKAGGTGLNLTAASHVIHLDRWWNPAVEDQATDRAYRIGQKRTVLVHKLVGAGTVEERIDEVITSKRALAQKVVGAGEQWITELSTDDLRDVLALREVD